MVFEVEKILKKRTRDDQVAEYLCSWKGWSDQTCETADTLTPGASEILSAFNNSKNPMHKKGKQKRIRST